MARKMPDAQRQFRDYQASQFAKGAAKKYNKGTFTATQTGAADMAVKRNFLDAALNMSDKKPLSKGIAGKRNY